MIDGIEIYFHNWVEVEHIYPVPDNPGKFLAHSKEDFLKQCKEHGLLIDFVDKREEKNEAL